MDAFVLPKTLTYARERAGFTLDALARKLSIKDPEKLAKWEAGERLPTYQQAEKLAKVTGYPFALLYVEPVEI